MQQGNATMEHFFGGWKIPLVFNPLMLATISFEDVEGTLKILAILVTIVAGVINIMISYRKWKRGR